jgi:hippurate hydrolase
MVSHRHHLHRHPEVGLELPDTHRYVVEQLEKLGLDVQWSTGTGVTTRIKGTGSDQKPIIFRSDMDALPVEEAVDTPFRSTRPGAMHACGHDLHMATLLGLAHDLVARPPQRDVILAFQPGEESDRGALQTLTHRNLDVAQAETFAVHVNAVLPVGTVAFSRDVFMAFGDWFELDIAGDGGHASAPERVGNPIRAGAIMQERLVDLANQLTDAYRVVATTTEFLSGNTVNVIPTSARLRGTLRTVTESQRDALHKGFHEILNEVSRSHKLDAKLSIIHGYPAVVCDPGFVEQCLGTWSNSDISATLTEMDHPSMVIEDYSYFLQKWPGAMVYVGAAVGENPSFNHSATAAFDDEAMSTAFSLFRALAPSEDPSR